MGGAAFLLARSLEYSHIANVLISSASLFAAWKLFSPTKVIPLREASIKIGQREMSLKHAMVQLVATTNIPNMSHAELCNLLRRASAFLAPYSFIPCRNNKMSVQELARIFVKDTMQVPNSIDALAGLLGLQSDQNKALFHDEKERIKRFEKMVASSKKFTKEDMRIHFPHLENYRVGEVVVFDKLPNFGIWTVKSQNGSIWELIYEGKVDSKNNIIIWPSQGRKVAGEEFTFLGTSITVYPGAIIQLSSGIPRHGIWHVQTEDKETRQFKYVASQPNQYLIIWPVGDRRSRERLILDGNQEVYPGDKIQCTWTTNPLMGNWTILKEYDGVWELLYEGSPTTERCIIRRSKERGFERDKYTFSTNLVIYPGAEINVRRYIDPKSGYWTEISLHENSRWLRYQGCPYRQLDIYNGNRLFAADLPQIVPFPEDLRLEAPFIDFNALFD